MSSMKEMAIREYVSKIDFKNDDWKLSQIKEDMRKFLGEEPGIEVVYKKDVMVNEVSGESKEFLDIDICLTISTVLKLLDQLGFLRLGMSTLPIKCSASIFSCRIFINNFPCDSVIKEGI